MAVMPLLGKYSQTPLGIRYSMHELSYYDPTLSITLTMIGQTQ